ARCDAQDVALEHIGCARGDVSEKDRLQAGRAIPHRPGLESPGPAVEVETAVAHEGQPDVGAELSGDQAVHEAMEVARRGPDGASPHQRREVLEWRILDAAGPRDVACGAARARRPPRAADGG